MIVCGGQGRESFLSTNDSTGFDPLADKYKKQNIDFKASRSNSLFGKSQTNQMASLRLLAIVKY